MKFPNAPNDHRYLKDLTIISRLFHSFAFTGKGTQILLAKPTEPVETTFPTHVVVKDSWPTPAETHEAYLIKHVRECLDDWVHNYCRGNGFGCSPPLHDHHCSSLQHSSL